MGFPLSDLPALSIGYVIFLTVVIGLCMGSFLNCTAWRMTHDESVMHGRSHCPSCGHVLSTMDLVPVFSWLFLRGRCRYCGEHISARYPLTEALMALVYVSVVVHYGVTLEALEMCVLMSLLLCLSLTDIDDFIIPNVLIVIGIINRLAYILVMDLVGGFQLAGFFADCIWTLVGGLCVAVPLLLITFVVDRLMHKSTMGGGDIKLFFLIGLYFTWQESLLLVIFACLIGIVFAIVFLKGRFSRDKPFPFGPSISIATWVTSLFGLSIIGWYLSLF